MSVSQNSRAIFQAGLEIYHMLNARQEHGDQAVLLKTADRFRYFDDLNELEAMARAVHLFQGVDRLVARHFQFAAIRAELHQEAAAAKGREAVEFAGGSALA